MNKIEIENEELKFEFPYFQCPNEIFDKDIEIEDINKNKNKRFLDSHEKLVLIYLFRCCNNGKKAFPSYKTIGQRCSCSERKALYVVNNLMHNEFVVKKNRGFMPGNDGQVKKNFSNVYEINRKKFA